MAFSGAQGVLRVGVCPSVRCTYTCRCSRVRDCSRGGERDAESESEEREKGGGGGRGNSAALPSDCVVKGVQPSPVGPHTRGLRGDRGEGNQPASVTHPPLMLRSIPQTQSQIATGAPTLLIVSSSSPHHPPRCLLIYTLIDVSRLSRPHSITHPPPPPNIFLFSPRLPSPSSSSPASFFLPLHQERFCSVYSPKLRLPNKVKPNPTSPASALSHPIWKSCFFPCGPGVLFTGDSRAGSAVLMDTHMAFMLIQQTARVCFEFHDYESIPCDSCHIQHV